MRGISLVPWSAVALLLTSCGYHVGGKADLMPKSIQTISIPTISSWSTRYKFVDALPQQIGREFEARTRFRAVNDPSVADAVLNITLNSVSAFPNLSDPTTGRASSAQVTVILSINLLERATGRVLYSRSGWGFRQYYEIAGDPHQFFDESGPAFDRLTRDVAHDVVSGVAENF
jgi:hypothetical protein